MEGAQEFRTESGAVVAIPSAHAMLEAYKKEGRSRTEIKVIQKSMGFKYEPSSEPLHVPSNLNATRLKFYQCPRSTDVRTSVPDSRIDQSLKDFVRTWNRSGKRSSLRSSSSSSSTSRSLPLSFFCFTLVTGPRRSLSLNLSDTGVYEPQMRARLGTRNPDPHFSIFKLGPGLSTASSRGSPVNLPRHRGHA